MGGEFVASESTVFSVAACYSNQPLLKTLEDIVHKSGISKLHEKNILLTGGTGFVGYYTVLALLYANDSLELNNKVILVVRDYKKALAGFGGMILRSDIRIMIQDIRERFILPDQCNIDYIIHCAMTSETSAMENDPLGVFYTAIAGTKNIIRLAEEKRVKSLVYLSSVTVYGGDSFDNHKISEDYTGVRDWKKDQDCYSLGKRSGEFLCLAEHRKRGLPVKILRPGYVYGASFREDNRVYAQIINAAAAGKNIVLRSGGYLCRPMVHVADLVKGIFLTLTDGEDGTAYNVSTAYCTIREFAQIAANSGEVCLTFEHEADIPYDKKRIVHTGNMDCKRMEDLAGKEIFYSLEKGIYSSIIVEAALFDCENEQEYII